jgi:hypothetical protein
MMRAAADLGNRCAAARLPANCSVSRLALFVGGWVGGWVRLLHWGDHACLLLPLLQQQLSRCTPQGWKLQVPVRPAPLAAAAAPQLFLL